MRRLFSLLMGVGLGGAIVWGSAQYHVLRTDNGFTYVPKREVSLAEPYFDVRNWGMAEWSQHPDLVLTLVKNDRKDVMGQSDMFETTLKDAFNSFKK
jgi:hypothetical protein